MKKLFLLIVIQVITILSVYSQTISRPSIYEGKLGKGVHLAKFLDDDKILFIYQNPNYHYANLLDLISFALPDIDNAIALTNKILVILNMEKTDKNVTIEDTFIDLRLFRNGKYQQWVSVWAPNVSMGCRFKKEETIKLKMALLEAKSKMNK
jgi:hypothetical protein